MVSGVRVGVGIGVGVLVGVFGGGTDIERRNPTLLPELAGKLLIRQDERHSQASSLRLPPRKTL
jgi:hypothetical protein